MPFCFERVTRHLTFITPFVAAPFLRPRVSVSQRKASYRPQAQGCARARASLLHAPPAGDTRQRRLAELRRVPPRPPPPMLTTACPFRHKSASLEAHCVVLLLTLMVAVMFIYRLLTSLPCLSGFCFLLRSDGEQVCARKCYAAACWQGVTCSRRGACWRISFVLPRAQKIL